MVQRKKNKISAEKWIEIRNAYVQGNENEQGQRTYPSLETLAKANGIHWNTIHRNSMWLDYYLDFKNSQFFSQNEMKKLVEGYK